MNHVAPLCITISETAATTPMDIQEDENNTKKKSLVFDSGMATVFEAVRQDMDRLCLSRTQRGCRNKLVTPLAKAWDQSDEDKTMITMRFSQRFRNAFTN